MRELTYTEAAREALGAEMERDPTIFVLGEGIGKRGGNFNTTVGLHDLYGDAQHDALIVGLKEELQKLRRQYGDTQ